MSDPVVFETELWPVPAARAVAALARQPGLAAPAKLVRSRAGETGLVGEVPRLAGLADGPGLAERALAAARAWLEGGWLEGGEPSPAGGPAPERVERALAEGPYAFARLAADRWRVDADPDGVVARLEVAAAGPDAVRVVAEGAVALPGPECFGALSAFALAANRRLRLARLSLRAGAGSARVTWDCVVPVCLPLAEALREALEAVAAARALCAGPLRALANPALAELYLSLRADGVPASPGRESGNGTQPARRPNA